MRPREGIRSVADRRTGAFLQSLHRTTGHRVAEERALRVAERPTATNETDAALRLSTFQRTQVWTDTREIISDAPQFFRRDFTQPLDMRAIHSRTLVGGGLLQLAQQIGVVLSGEARPVQEQIALAQGAVAALAPLKIDACAYSERSSVADALRRRRKARQIRHVRRHIRQILRAVQMMLIREMLHALIPALVVTKIRELLEQDAAVLASDRRDLSILGAAPVWTVAGSAALKQVGAMREIRFEPRAVGEFPVTGHTRVGGLGPGGAMNGDQCQ